MTGRKVSLIKFRPDVVRSDRMVRRDGSGRQGVEQTGKAVNRKGVHRHGWRTQTVGMIRGLGNADHVLDGCGGDG